MVCVIYCAHNCLSAFTAGLLQMKKKLLPQFAQVSNLLNFPSPPSPQRQSSPHDHCLLFNMAFISEWPQLAGPLSFDQLTVMIRDWSREGLLCVGVQPKDWIDWYTAVPTVPGQMWYFSDSISNLERKNLQKNFSTQTVRQVYFGNSVRTPKLFFFFLSVFEYFLRKFFCSLLF